LKRAIFAAAVTAGLIGAAPAGAANWHAWLGEPTQPPANAPKGAELNQFFPAKITIRAGDKITYSTHAFHTATYLGGAPRPALAGPDSSGGKYAGINDAAGAPFYFDGLPKFVYDVAAFAPVGGPKVTRGSMHSTGAVAPDENSTTASAALSFPKAGTYQIVCLIHPGMTETVVVKAKSKKAKTDTVAKVATRIGKETRAAWAKTVALAQTPVPANTVFAGIGGKQTLLAFVPSSLTVKAGTTVSFVNMAPSEIHNEAWGPPDYIQSFMQQTDLFPNPQSSANQMSPVLVYGTDPPAARAYDGSNHGNGFFATNLTDDQPGDPPNGLPQTNTVTFTKPGTYHYFCLIHGPDMSGDIVVTP
jgi:plastocyanin